MGFWIFMLIMDLLIPLTLIGFGRYFSNNAPRQINAVFGYRTAMSMKNQDTWLFAHNYCGKLWFRSGLALLPITIIPLLCVIGGTKDTIGMVGSVICGIQMIPLIGSVFFTENALKKSFDKGGNRR